MRERAPSATPDGIITKTTTRSLEEVLAQLTSLIEAKGMKLFAVVDHSGEALQRGLALRTTKVVVFGSPVLGTPLMRGTPLIALDLPLKVLLWDDDGTTTVSYYDPRHLAARYGLSEEIVAPLNGINVLTDLATAVE